MTDDLDRYVQQYHDDNMHSSATHLFALLKDFREWLKLKGKEVWDFDEPDAREYFQKMSSDGYSRTTKKEVKEAMIRLMRYHYDGMPSDFQTKYEYNCRIDRVGRHIKFPKEAGKDIRHALTLEELDTLFDICRGRNRDFSTFYCLAFFGMRRGEWRRIKKLDFDNGIMVVQTEKTQKLRPLCFDQYTRSILEEAWTKGWLYNGANLYKLCRNYKYVFEGTNLKFSPHCFRYTFNAHGRNKWKDDALLKKLTGHTSQDMTDYYDETFLQEIRQALAVNHWIFDVPTIRKKKAEYDSRMMGGTNEEGENDAGCRTVEASSTESTGALP